MDRHDSPHQHRHPDATEPYLYRFDEAELVVMGLFNLYDPEAESSDDIVRMEIEREAEEDFWEYMTYPWDDGLLYEPEEDD